MSARMCEDKTLDILFGLMFVIGIAIGFFGAILFSHIIGLPAVPAKSNVSRGDVVAEKIPLPEEITVGDYVVGTADYDASLGKDLGPIRGRVYALHDRIVEWTPDGLDKRAIGEAWVRRATQAEIDAMPGMSAGAQLDRNFAPEFAQGCLNLAHSGVMVNGTSSLLEVTQGGEVEVQ